MPLSIAVAMATATGGTFSPTVVREGNLAVGTEDKRGHGQRRTMVHPGEASWTVRRSPAPHITQNVMVCVTGSCGAAGHLRSAPHDGCNLDLGTGKCGESLSQQTLDSAGKTSHSLLIFDALLWICPGRLLDVVNS